MSKTGVRRDKAALSSGCKPHPATRDGAATLPQQAPAISYNSDSELRGQGEIAKSSKGHIAATSVRKLSPKLKNPRKTYAWR